MRRRRRDLVKGKTIGIDATTLEANAALRSIVRRDTGESVSGVSDEARAGLGHRDADARGSWRGSIGSGRRKARTTTGRIRTIPTRSITKMKDGRTHLAHKAEHAVDLETGAIVGVTCRARIEGDTTTISETLTAAAGANSRRWPPRPDDDDREIVADKGYHSNDRVSDLGRVGLRTYIAEPDRGRRRWKRPADARDAVYRNRRRIRGTRGQRLLRRRGESPRTTVCASLRDRRAAPHASARPHEHSEARADSCRWLQSRARDATL